MIRKTYFYGQYCSLLLCLLTYPGYAQLTVERGTLTVGNASKVQIAHNIVNQGTIYLNGLISLSGNLRNEQSLFGESGTLSLVGQNQSIVTPLTTLGVLQVDGGGVKSLQGELIVRTSFALTSGVLLTSGQLTLLPSTQITGGSAQSYVDGFLYHQGTGSKLYPVGRDGTYAPATLLNVTGDDPVVGMAYFSSPAIDGTPFHWQVQTLSGTYRGSRAELTFTAPNTDYAAYRDEIMVLGAETPDTDFTSLGQSTLAGQGDRFTISSDEPSALPLLTVGFDIPVNTQNLYLPNAFSASAPNPEDQCVKVYGQQISPNNFYLAIQDVWGNLLYETRSWEEASATGWRGPTGSSEVAATYRYLLRGEFIGGKSFQQSGTILHY